MLSTRVVDVVVDHRDLIIAVRGGVWGRRRPQTVWHRAASEEAGRAAAEALKGDSGSEQAGMREVDMVVADDGQVQAAEVWDGGVRTPAIGSTEVSADGGETRLTDLIAGAARGTVLGATITSAEERDQAIGIVIEGGRLVRGTQAWSLSGERAETWYAPNYPHIARQAIAASLNRPGEVCLISDGEGRCFAVRDTTGAVPDREILFSIHT